MNEPSPRPSRLAWLRTFFLRPSSLSITVVVGIGMMMGLIFWGGFNTGMEATNSLAFCTSCHEIRSGVRAACPDCHVPKDWVHKFVRKVQASNELYSKFITGAVDTPEKFETHRMEMATHVWATMKATDSRECRNCHSWDAMDPHKQSSRASKKMAQAQKEGKTCIDCHKGIAHLLPKEYKEDEE
jgi:nitrate/TMAO reductase-like tetraheme cytochrome c subunit